MPDRTRALASRFRDLTAEAAGPGPRAVAAAAELAGLRDGLRALDLPALDGALRRERYPEDGWDGLTVADLRRIAALPHGGAVVQALTCHRSGYVREAAVRRLAVVSDHADVGFLLLRVNDWVLPVRRAATAALRVRARSDLARALVRALPLLERMRRWGRIDEPALLADLEAAIGPADLATGLASPDLGVRRSCARRLVDGGLDEPAIDRALADPDPVVRRLVAGRVCRAAGPGFDRCAARLLRDRVASIRRDALSVAVSRGVSAEPHAADPDAGTRRIAQAALLAGGDDLAGRYRRLLAAPAARTRAIALVGMVETEGAAATEEVRRHLTDAEPRVRAAALVACAALRLPDLGEILVAALADPVSGPRRTARDLVRGKRVRVAPAAVWTAFTTAPRGEGQRPALAVLAGCDYWPRLPYLLRATADPDPELHHEARQHVWTWLARRSRVFSIPSQTEVAAILAALVIARIPSQTSLAVATAVATPATPPS